MSQPNGHIDYDERSPLLPCRIEVEPNSTSPFVQQTSNGNATLGKRIWQSSSRSSVSSSQITLSWENINASVRATSTRCCCRKSQSLDAVDKQILFNGKNLNFIFSLSRLSCTNVIHVVSVKEILKLDTNTGWIASKFSKCIFIYENSVSFVNHTYYILF